MNIILHQAPSHPTKAQFLLVSLDRRNKTVIVFLFHKKNLFADAAQYDVVISTLAPLPGCSGHICHLLPWLYYSRQ